MPPQPIVITPSEAWTASTMRIFGDWSAMSMTTSAIASMAAGFTVSAGAEPAERSE
ncbi:hypothetical protein JYA75_28525 (plasmid) [Rhodococcus sp. PSBB066]|nr:hypothetical protein JQ505_28020 [Rhodococcus aetherivorans]QSE62434.1 hypothetical protein JYA75_28525 [Rhodococcus sp. PSBB066]